jgi:hypothetical protein
VQGIAGPDKTIFFTAPATWRSEDAIALRYRAGPVRRPYILPIFAAAHRANDCRHAGYIHPGLPSVLPGPCATCSKARVDQGSSEKLNYLNFGSGHGKMSLSDPFLFCASFIG